MAQHRAPRHAAAVSKLHGRRRALDPASEPSNITPLTGSLPVVKAGERRAALQLERELAIDATASHRPRHSAVAVAATTGLLMISAMSGTIASTTVAESQPATEPEPETGMMEAIQPDLVITADEHQQVLQTKVEVKTEPAPPPPAEPAITEPVEPEPAVIPEQTFVRRTDQFVLGGYAYEAPSDPPPASPVVPSANKNQTILTAALGQLGMWQDCTMLVTNSLAAVGIYFHDWPAGYMTLGTVISAEQAVPGDLIYYMDGGAGVPHIAVYAGNGQAVHGGWNGSQTVVYSAYVGSGPVFIRVA